MVELLVALAILALVVGLVLPIAGGSRRGGDGAMVDALAELRQARATALREARPIALTGMHGGSVVFYADGSSTGGDVTIGAAVLRVDRLSGRISRAE